MNQCIYFSHRAYRDDKISHRSGSVEKISALECIDERFISAEIIIRDYEYLYHKEGWHEGAI